MFQYIVLLPDTCCAFYGQILLSAGASVDAADNSGQTALMTAGTNGCFFIAQVKSPTSTFMNYNATPIVTMSCPECLSVYCIPYERFVVLLLERC